MGTTLNVAALRSINSAGNLAGVFKAMQDNQVNRSHLTQLLNDSEKVGPAQLDLSTQAIILRSSRGDFEESAALVNWAAAKGGVSRKTVVSSFIKGKQSVLFVHQVARLKRKEAGESMKDYFSEGGTLDDVAEWLAKAGAILKTGLVPDGNDGLWGWIKDTAGAVVDAVTGAINTIADAIAAAGKSLADAVSAVVGWAQNKINDFVEAVLAAGKKVSEMLAEALKKGLAAVKKFVTAIIQAGRQGLEVLNWAVGQALDVLKAALQELERLYGSFTTLLLEIGKMAVAQLKTAIRAVMALGHTVLEVVQRLERLAYETAKIIVGELIAMGKSLKEIMTAVINLSRYTARIVLDGLLSAGKLLKDILTEVVSKTAQAISVILGALKDMGKTLAYILDSMAAFVSTQANRLMEALRIIWTQTSEILEAIAGKALHAVKTLLTALLGTGMHLLDVVKNIIVDVRAAFREGLIKGLIELGKSALILMKEAVKISAGVAATLFAVLMNVLGSHRKLTAVERAEAEKVFGVSIDLDMVRLTDASFAADFIMWMNKNRPFTTMYVINHGSGVTLPTSTLIHELTHVWQAVTSGGVYMIEALHSQFFGQGYNLTVQDIQNAAGNIKNLEREQQAVLVEEYWKAKFNGQSIAFPLDLIAPLATQVYKTKYKPISGWFERIDLGDFTLNPSVVVPAPKPGRGRPGRGPGR
ncbi:MAG: hypothetical protein QE278_12750 [Limnobacter sp.]|nr:hypothetical protein [Limnobacter sp.]